MPSKMGCKESAVGFFPGMENNFYRIWPDPKKFSEDLFPQRKISLLNVFSKNADFYLIKKKMRKNVIL